MGGVVCLPADGQVNGEEGLSTLRQSANVQEAELAAIEKQHLQAAADNLRDKYWVHKTEYEKYKRDAERELRSGGALPSLPDFGIILF
jgi:molecular chaperone GrpE (heat shock protein)